MLVDTPLQLNRPQPLLGEPYGTVIGVAQALSDKGSDVRTLTNEEFRLATVSADAVLSVAVYDAVPPATRAELAQAAAQNLRSGGWYVVIVPRNDTSITSRCTEENAFDDGHLFCRGESCTFFRNFRDHGPLVALIQSAGLTLAADRSSYRQVWLYFEKP